jgi:hypothetical protein
MPTQMISRNNVADLKQTSKLRQVLGHNFDENDAKSILPLCQW